MAREIGIGMHLISRLPIGLSRNLEGKANMTNQMKGKIRRSELGLFLSILIVKLIFILTIGPITNLDSGEFRNRGLSVTHSPLLDFLGDKWFRPWTVVGVYKLMPNDVMRVMAQVFISTIAWSLFIVVILRFLKVRAVRYLFLGLTLLVCFGERSLQADCLIGHESIGISLILIVLVLTIGFLQTSNFAILGLWVVVSSMAIVTRFTTLPIVFSILVCIVTLKWKTLIKYKRKFLGITVSLVLTISYLILYVSNTSNLEFIKGTDHQNLSVIQYGYIVSDENPQAQEVIDALKALNVTKLRCSIPSEPLSTVHDLAIAWHWTLSLQKSCPQGRSWVKSNFGSWYAKYVVMNPRYVLGIWRTIGGQVFPSQNTLIQLSGGIDVSPIPSILDLNGSGLLKFSTLPLLILGMLIFLFFFKAENNMTRIDHKSVRKWTFAVGTIYFGFGLSILMGILLCPTHPSDIARISSIAEINLMAFSISILCMGIDMAKRISSGKINTTLSPTHGKG